MKLVNAGWRAVKAWYKNQHRSRYWAEVVKTNQVLKNRHRGQRCFVIGTGPSINQQPLEQLKDEITLGVNNYFRHKSYKKVQPRYYALMDPVYFDGKPAHIQYLKEMASKLAAETELFLPIKVKDKTETHNYFGDRIKHYLWQQGRANDEMQFEIDLDKKTMGILNVIQSSLMAANYMGCKPIYLLGCEHDWTKNPNNEVGHFYTQAPFKSGQPKYEKVLQDAYELFRGYRLMDMKLSAKVYNLTPGSFLDVFEKKEWHQIIKKRKK